MKNEIKNNNKTSINSLPTKSNIKDQKLELLISGDHYIAFNKKQDIPIWNYLLSEDKTKIFIYDEDDNTIYDEFVIDAPNTLFTYGEYFEKVSFKNLDLEENIVTRKNFYLFTKQFSNNIKEEF